MNQLENESKKGGFRSNLSGISEDFQSHNFKDSPNSVPSTDQPDTLSPTAKTSLRIQYEAQVEVIRRQIGGLEAAREKLGLSQRKMAQLLLVDPSAWSRWIKSGGEDAPAHIYRALQWYLALQEKIPGLTPQYFIGKDPEVLHVTAMKHLKNEAQQRTEEMQDLAEHMNQQLQELQKHLFQRLKTWIILAAAGVLTTILSLKFIFHW
jgi:transcriptional regulator with XRE-family HTH domain